MLQQMVVNFNADFKRQTNLLLGVSDHLDVPGPVDLPPLAPFFQSAPIPEVAPPVEEKKERKKRTHDPNAPKRPLTPYFLYMQTARPIIANDLGNDAAKGAVQKEGQRRWADMNPGEKAVSNLPANPKCHIHGDANTLVRAGPRLTSITFDCTMPAFTRTRLAIRRPRR
jgi:hypothetical protein